MDYFNSNDIVNKMFSRQKNSSKIDMNKIGNDTKAMAEILSQQAEIRATNQEVTNLQSIAGEFKNNPLFGMYNTYAVAQSVFLKPGNDLYKYMEKLIDAMNGFKVNNKPEVMKLVGTFMCQAIVGFTMLDCNVVRQKAKPFDFTTYLNKVQEVVGQLDPEVEAYGKQAQALCEQLALAPPPADWARVQQMVEPTLKDAVNRQVFAPFVRPEFISNLEEDDIFDVKTRYCRRPNIVAAAELAVLK